MHEIEDAIVEGGTLVLGHLPFEDGQHVRVLVIANSPAKRPIADARQLLRGHVLNMPGPDESMITPDDWEMRP